MPCSGQLLVHILTIERYGAIFACISVIMYGNILIDTNEEYEDTIKKNYLF